MRFLDISGNNIVLRFLDNIIVTSGYKFSLESLEIEKNFKLYKGSNGYCSCMSGNKRNEMEGV